MKNRHLFIARRPYFSVSNKLCRRGEQAAHGRRRVALAEDRSARDEYLCTGRGGVGDVVGAYAAVNLYARLKAPLVYHTSQTPHLIERRRDELLTAEAGVDRHHEHVVGVRKRLLNRAQTRRGV